MMILGTWGAGWAGYQWGPWTGVLVGTLMGAAGGAIHAIATVTFGVDHIVSGVALNIVALGFAKYLSVRFFSTLPGGGPTQSPPLEELPTISIPWLSDALGELEQQHIFFISDLAGVLRAFCTNVSVVTILAVLLFIATAYILWRSAFGLRLRSVGESPVAAVSLGVNVLRYKFTAVLVSGGLAGLGGGFLALVAANVFRDGQTGGRGYIGLAAMIFGNWRPGGLMAGSVLFGYTDALRLRTPSAVHALLLLVALFLIAYAIWRFVKGARRTGIVLGVLGIGIWQIVRKGRVVQGVIALVVGVVVGVWDALTDIVPPELSSTLPYVTTLLVLAFASQRLRMPAADGQIYRKGEGH
jgi:simple sugar transport system permease protein